MSEKQYLEVSPELYGKVCTWVATEMQEGTIGDRPQDEAQRLYPTVHPDDLADIIETAREGWARLQVTGPE